MWAHYQNIAPFFLKGKSEEVVKKVQTFFTQQDTWMRGMIAKYAKSDPLWAHAGYILAQYDGLYAGYKAAGKAEWVSHIQCNIIRSHLVYNPLLDFQEIL